MGWCGFVNAEKIFRDFPTMSLGDLRLLRPPLHHSLRESLAPSHKSLSRVWPVQMSSHSQFTSPGPAAGTVLSHGPA